MININSDNSSPSFNDYDNYQSGYWSNDDKMTPNMININSYNVAQSFDECIQLGYGFTDLSNNELIDIISSSTRRYSRLSATGTRLKIKFKNPDVFNLDQWMVNCFAQLLELIKEKSCIEPCDRVGFSFLNVENDKIAFNISFRRFDQYTPEVIMSALDNVLQSNTQFLIDDALIINVDHVRVPVGYGRRTFVGKSLNDYMRIHKFTVLSPKLWAQHNNICLPVAIFLGMLYANGDVDQNKLNYFTYSQNYDEMIENAKRIADQANVDYQNGCSIDEILKFEEYLKFEYNLTVYNSRNGKSVYRKSKYTNKKHINLLLESEHYILIKSLTAAFSSAYFCEYCAEPYNTRFQHKSCPFKCDRCFRSPPCVKAADITCFDCNRVFVNANCFQFHVKTNICNKIKNCLRCCSNYSVDKKKKYRHICDTKYCFICKKILPIRHECFISKPFEKQHKENAEIFIFFDLECTQTDTFGNDSDKLAHVPNLCVAHQACDTCCSLEAVDVICNNCGLRNHTFEGQNIIEKFMNYVGSISDKFKRIKIIAHNLQKYDGHFLLQHMYINSASWPFKENSLIMNGSKILLIKIGRYRFIDSLNFFGVALSKLPSMFNLSCADKGYYPHFFNTNDNYNYEGIMPDPKFYGFDAMKENDRKKFLQWYNTQNGCVFNNKKELLKYWFFGSNNN